MKILIANSYYYPNCNGGAELCARSLAEHLLIMGNQVEVLTIDSKTHTDTVNGVRVLYLSSLIRKWRYKKGIRRWISLILYLFMDFINFPRYIKEMKDKYDIVHVHAVEDFTASIWIAAIICKIPVVYTMHDDYIQCHRLFLQKRDNSLCVKPTLLCRIRCSFNKWILKKANAKLVVLSEHLRLKRQIDAEVIPNGIAINQSEHEYSMKPFRIAYIGNLNPIKGVEMLIEAFRHISLENCELHIAGDGELRQIVEKAAEDNENIFYHGWVKSERKEKFFNEASVVVCPSIYENMPYVILEAYCNGIPVIASNVGAIPEMVEHNKTGLLFQAGNMKELEMCLINMATNAKLYLACCHGAYEKAMDYSMDTMSRKYYDVYRSLL